MENDVHIAIDWTLILWCCCLFGLQFCVSSINNNCYEESHVNPIDSRLQCVPFIVLYHSCSIVFRPVLVASVTSVMKMGWEPQWQQAEVCVFWEQLFMQLLYHLYINKDDVHIAIDHFQLYIYSSISAIIRKYTETVQTYGLFSKTVQYIVRYLHVT